ncbi:MAG: hypothetical protein M1837_005753 [Sclerophora amabilis]|nr:MAG: hypothetical protein M1837_005753 [Sclerophora amabilis]
MKLHPLLCGPHNPTKIRLLRKALSCDSHKAPPNLHQQYSTLVSARSEDVKLSTGSSGQFTLNIHHPLTGSDDGPILLYFPRRVPFSDGLPDQSVITSLSSTIPNGTIVRVNYRFDELHKFPTALHDSLTAFDWVTSHVGLRSPLPSSSSPSGVEAFQSYESSNRRMIGVCGELVGGFLASAVALTECQLGRPRVSAVAVNNPVVDWTFGLSGTPKSEVYGKSSDTTTIEESQRSSEIASSNQKKSAATPKSRSKSSQSELESSSTPQLLSSSHLSSIRKLCFPGPESYFDPFASPLFFFRTPGIALPNPNLLGEDSLPKATAESSFISQRKSPRRHPPRGSGLSLPSARITVGSTNWLHHQGTELATLMRRSMVVSARRAKEEAEGHLLTLDEPDEEQSSSDRLFIDEARAEAERKVQLVELEGLGLWGADQTGQEDIADVGSWFRHVLSSP